MLDIYIALDVSDSIDKEDFEKAKGVIKTLIEKVYEINSMLITQSHTFNWLNPLAMTFPPMSHY